MVLKIVSKAIFREEFENDDENGWNPQNWSKMIKQLNPKIIKCKQNPKSDGFRWKFV